jgi:hypothetical protein
MKYSGSGFFCGLKQLLGLLEKALVLQAARSTCICMLLCDKFVEQATVSQSFTAAAVPQGEHVQQLLHGSAQEQVSISCWQPTCSPLLHNTCQQFKPRTPLLLLWLSWLALL